MKNVITILFLGVLSVSYSQNCNLFFSEYLEGASNNKAIEIYNPLTTSVDLFDYKIYRYNNGSSIPTDSLQLMGTLAPGAVYVAGNPSAVAAILSVSDTLHTITFFNGDDAMELRYKPTQTMIDIIGIIGNDPGTNWSVGTGATSEFTLVRMFVHTDGETNWAIGATEWDIYPQNTVSNLGSHTGASCCSTTTDTITVSSCENYIWAQNGVTYTISGSYNDTIQNVTGCDSVITLVLTILNSTTSSISASACTSYTWSQNGITYTVSGIYNDTILNTNGCDSIIQLNLTIHPITDTVLYEVSCGPYTWPVNGMVYNFPGQFRDTLLNVNGCDSIIVLNLTIYSQPNVIASQNGDGSLTVSIGGGFYQWINCTTNQVVGTQQTFMPTSNGSYAVIYTSPDWEACSDTSNCIPVTNLGLSKTHKNALEIYPNPATEAVFFRFNAESIQLKLMDINGNTLLQQTLVSEEKMDVSAIAPGMYLIYCTNHDANYSVQRLVIE